MKNLILEGSDLIGKSTAAKMIASYLPVQDRHMKITHAITPTHANHDIIKEVISEQQNTLFVFMYAGSDQWFDERLPKRDKPDEFDLLCREYNQMYMKVIAAVRHFPNVDFFDVYGLNPYQKAGRIFESYLKFVESFAL